MRRNLRQYPGLGRDLFVRFVAQAGEAVTAHHDVEAAAWSSRSRFSRRAAGCGCSLMQVRIDRGELGQRFCHVHRRPH